MSASTKPAAGAVNGHATLEGRAAPAFLPGFGSTWIGSPEHRRWLYWQAALEVNDLTAEEREERLELVGGLDRARCARDAARVDFETRLNEEQLNAGNGGAGGSGKTEG